MTAVTVSATFDVTAHYSFIPDASFGTGVISADPIFDYVAGSAESPATLSVQLENSLTWNVLIEMRGAEPIIWDSLDVGSGGNLFTLLESAGWTPGQTAFTPLPTVIDGGSA